MPVCPYLGIHALRNNDGIIHDDAENQDEAEQTDHVDRGRPWSVGHQPQCSEKRDRNTDDHPGRNPQAHEHRQDKKYDHSAHEHVFDHQVQTALQIKRAVYPQGHFHTLWQRARLFLHVLLDRSRCIQLVLLAQRQDSQGYRRLAVELSPAFGFDKLVTNCRNVTK